MNGAVSTVGVTRLDSTGAGFAAALQSLVSTPLQTDAGVESDVRAIIEDVRARGDAAVLQYTRRFDRRAVDTMSELFITTGQMRAAWSRIDAPTRQALEVAARRIRDYHQRQLQASWSYVDDEGTQLGQKVTALDRAGLYVPGGKAAYPSSVLMNAIPARVAGVASVTLVVPAPGGEISDLVLAAAHLAEVKEVITIGGAQAIAALAYGTESVRRVDKIVGPGNAYVAAAKRLVFGAVGIDMIAGPSEILILCDGHTDPDWIALDMFAQAEHDEDARAVLLSPDAEFLDRVAAAVDRLLPEMERAAIIRKSLETRGAIIKVKDLEEGIAIANHIAPEHLELSVRDPQALLPDIRNAGAVFMGPHTAEAVGDYCAGPNHVLPTGGSARFSSPLGVYDFQKRTSVIHCSARGARSLGAVAARLARGEALTAHARSAEIRGGA